MRALAVLLVLMLAACTTLSAEEERRLVELTHEATLRQLETSELAELQALKDKAESGDFDLNAILGGLMSFLASIGFITWQRGSVNNRKGVSPKG